MIFNHVNGCRIIFLIYRVNYYHLSLDLVVDIFDKVKKISVYHVLLLVLRELRSQNIHSLLFYFSKIKCDCVMRETKINKLLVFRLKFLRA
jgi:hypothetical protein